MISLEMSKFDSVTRTLKKKVNKTNTFGVVGYFFSKIFSKFCDI